jgi:REP element-mobilizing transposase RayT
LGEIVDGDMRLNTLGQMVNACWQRLPSHFPHLALDAFVVMPNHIYGILVLTQPDAALNRRGAALEQDLTHLTDDVNSNATPNLNPLEPDLALEPDLTHLTDDVNSNATPNRNPSKPGVAFGRGMVDTPNNQLPNAAPLQPRLGSGSVGAMVLNFKSVTTRTRNRLQRSPGGIMWQRNYYEHIIRHEEALTHLR